MKTIFALTTDCRIADYKQRRVPHRVMTPAGCPSGTTECRRRSDRRERRLQLGMTRLSVFYEARGSITESGRSEKGSRDVR